MKNTLPVGIVLVKLSLRVLFADFFYVGYKLSFSE